ncbi:hypothetical protein K443DRAFT_14460 [Laccaria amethystina LaAM-08-1]|uniref:Uncharacterized protein n=1 Tax=Laccaria amethystina LaAM-08-1 TaxID=1095629 RepID=A0A0C9WMS2_9AGAR|nr:hypothetical protein K443DRAFT_14460 [Laccaria amethystina LaAM-08-1]
MVSMVHSSDDVQVWTWHIIQTSSLCHAADLCSQSPPLSMTPVPTAMSPSPPLPIATTTHDLHDTPSLGQVTSPSGSTSTRTCGEDPPPPNTNGNEGSSPPHTHGNEGPRQ